MEDDSSPFPSSSNLGENEEKLEEFRRRWKEELEQKKPSQQTTFPDTIPNTSKDLTDKDYSEDSNQQLSDHLDELDSVLPVSNGTDNGIKKSSAIEIYIKAITKEREGNLGEALKNYQQASKLDPGVEHAYRKLFHNVVNGENVEDFDVSKPFIQHLKEEFQLSTAPHEGDYVKEDRETPRKHCEGGGQHSDEGVDTKIHLSDTNSQENCRAGAAASSQSDKDSDQIVALLNSFRNMKLTYEPLIPYRPVSIAKLPNELVVCILKQFVIMGDTNSLERFGLACRKFWLLSREVSLWKYLCQKSYWNIDLSLGTSNLLQEEYVKFYDNDWRRMYIERPRIRLDGVYISTCHYLRPGSTENTWNQPIHLVTYYRYLRFYSDGMCITLLTTSEPMSVVRNFTPEYKSKGFMSGKWVLDGDIIKISAVDQNLPRFQFYLNFRLRSASRGKNNKLTWISYYSITDSTDERSDISLRNEKNYVFSKVKSYVVLW